MGDSYEVVGTGLYHRLYRKINIRSRPCLSIQVNPAQTEKLYEQPGICGTERGRDGVGSLLRDRDNLVIPGAVAKKVYGVEIVPRHPDAGKCG